MPDKPNAAKLPGQTTTLAFFPISARLNRLPIIPAHVWACVAIGIGLFFDFYDLFITTVLVTDFPQPHHGSALVMSATFGGMFVGTLVFSSVADLVGRRRAFLISILVYSIASLACAASPNLWFLLCARVVAGIGIGAELPVADTYLSDLLPTRYRGRFTALAYTVGFLGIPVAGLTARVLTPQTLAGIPGWRWMFVIGSLGAVATLFLRTTLPESPRWLEVVGKHDQAAATVAKMETAAAHRGPIPLPKYEEHSAPPASFTTSWTRPVPRRRWLMMLIFQPLQGVGYYGFGTLALLVFTNRGYSIVTSLTFVAVTYIGYPLGSLLSIAIIDRVDRRWLTVWSGLAMALCGMLFAFSQTSAAIVIFGFCYTAVSNIFSNSFHVYQVELFPTEVRARGGGIPYAASRLSIGVMPFLLVPVLEHFGSTIAFGSTGIALIIAVGSITLLGSPSTGLSLEEINDPRMRYPHTSVKWSHKSRGAPPRGSL